MKIIIGVVMTLLCVLTLGSAAEGTQAADAPVSKTSGLSEANKETLVDLFSSEAIERIDFIATSFDGAMNQIEVAIDSLSDVIVEQGIEIDDGGQCVGEVIRALDQFKPRMDGYNFGKLTLVVLDEKDARQLGELVGLATTLIEHDLISQPAVQASAKNLFRGVTIDLEEGIPPLEQLLDHVRFVTTLSPEKQRTFLR